MSAGPKPDSASFLAYVANKKPAAQADPSSKSGKPEGKTGFAPGNYYRQGVLVPGGPPKSATLRGKSR